MASELLRYEWKDKNQREDLSPTIEIQNDSTVAVVAAGTAMSYGAFGTYYYEYTATAVGGYHGKITVLGVLAQPIVISKYATLDPAITAATNAYTTVAKVESFLRLGTTLSASTSPTSTEVSRLISAAEDEIDNATNHAWRERYSGTKSGTDTTAVYEYHDINFRYEYRTGIPVYLKHRKLRSLDADSDDEFAIYNGSTWEDWLGDMTEGRANDYWIDYEQGIIYIIRRWSVRGPVRMRIKYRYGDSTVPRVIEQVATKLVAIDFLSTDDRSVQLPEGLNSFSFPQKVDRWQEYIDKNLNRFKEFRTMEGGTL